jgi:hypothetical protein
MHQLSAGSTAAAPLGRVVEAERQAGPGLAPWGRFRLANSQLWETALMPSRGATAGRQIARGDLSPAWVKRFEAFAAAMLARLGPDACWPGRRGLDAYSHTNIVVDGRKQSVHHHRLVAAYTAGMVAAGMVARHTCCRRGCLCPRHLEVTTQAGSILATVAAGRWRTNREGDSRHAASTSIARKSETPAGANGGRL